MKVMIEVKNAWRLKVMDILFSCVFGARAFNAQIYRGDMAYIGLFLFMAYIGFFYPNVGWCCCRRKSEGHFTNVWTVALFVFS